MDNISDNESIFDPFLQQLLEGYMVTEIKEIQQYINDWDAATYNSISQNILDHSVRKEIEPLKYLRKANNFSKKGASRIPKTGYRGDGSAVYRKGNRHLRKRCRDVPVERLCKGSG